jgi:hypothetical protein
MFRTISTELGNVYPRTVGVIFLGTPHRCTMKRSLGECVAIAALLSMHPPNNHLLGILHDSSDSFENQHGTFLMVSRDIQVVCVREELPTDSYMIPRESACYEGFNVTRDNIAANHTGLAKFASKDDLGYLQLVAHIKKLSSGPSQYGKSLFPGMQNVRKYLTYLRAGNEGVSESRYVRSPYSRQVSWSNLIPPQRFWVPCISTQCTRGRAGSAKPMGKPASG